MHQKVIIIGLYSVLSALFLDIAIHMTLPVFYAISGAFIPPLLKAFLDQKPQKKLRKK